MALRKRFANLKSEENTGFGTNSNNSGGRFYNRQGGANVLKKGVGILDRYSWYHTLLGMRRGKFLLLIFTIYIVINIVFAGIYYAIGIKHLSGINSGSSMKNFSEVFFFSTQTFTTVGYGRISPTGFMTSAVAPAVRKLRREKDPCAAIMFPFQFFTAPAVQPEMTHL